MWATWKFHRKPSSPCSGWMARSLMSINFPLILVLAVAVCGFLALFDLVLLAPRRRAAIATYAGQGVEQKPQVLQRLNKEPLLVEYGKSFFPVLAIVLVLRSFL